MIGPRIPTKEAWVAESVLRQVPISILDLSPVSSGSTPAAALQSTIRLAQHAESLGYTRFWVAEHHNHAGIASSSPAVLISAIAGATRAIRVGSGGVMLPNHPPLVVAEQFGTLEGIYPGRIDLGIGRAPGTDPITARALRRSVDGLTDDDFPQQLADLIGFLRGGLPDDHPLAPIRSVPRAAAVPPIWLLGSSGYSAQVAGMLGLPFGFAHHFSARNTIPALDLYRRSFRPSAVLDEPYALVAVRALIAETDEEAAWLAGSSALSFLRLSQGRPGPVPTPQEAADHVWTDEERAIVADRLAGQAVGSPETVSAYLAELLDACGANELMATTLAHDPQVRLDTATHLARLFGPRPPAGLDARPATEVVVLLDDRGRAIGTADKATVHHGQTPLHLAFSCYLFDEHGQLLVTQRAETKAVFPGIWTNSVCGHPGPAEHLIAAVERRVANELGGVARHLRVVLPEFRYAAEMDGIVEHEICPVLTGVVAHDGPWRPDPTEVGGMTWVPWASFVADVRSGSFAVSPWCALQVEALDALGPDPVQWPNGDDALLPPALRA